VPEPAHTFDLFYQFTSSLLALYSASLCGCSQSMPPVLPGHLMIYCAALFAQLDVLVTIPIDYRRCFTQRFSPTGFILNASHSNCCHPIALDSHSG
jgi:hypothetical protein